MNPIKDLFVVTGHQILHFLKVIMRLTKLRKLDIIIKPIKIMLFLSF